MKVPIFFSCLTHLFIFNTILCAGRSPYWLEDLEPGKHKIKIAPVCVSPGQRPYRTTAKFHIEWARVLHVQYKKKFRSACTLAVYIQSIMMLAPNVVKYYVIMSCKTPFQSFHILILTKRINNCAHTWMCCDCHQCVCVCTDEIM